MKLNNVSLQGYAMLNQLMRSAKRRHLSEGSCAVVSDIQELSDITILH